MTLAPLAGLVVAEVAGSTAGAYCGRMFVLGGATVYLIGEPNLTEAQTLFLHEGKRRASPTSFDWGQVDVSIVSSATGPVAEVFGVDGRAVNVNLSPFGMTGDRAWWRSSDLVDYAVSGHSYLYGDPEREPLAGPPGQPAIAAGLFAFIGAMAALLARDRLGSGQTVDVSHVQVMSALHQVTLLRWQMNQQVLCRTGNRYTGQGQPNGPYRCRDGWVSIAGVTSEQVEGLLAVSGLTHLLDHPLIDSPIAFQLHPELLDPPLNEWLADQSVDDVVELLQAVRVPAAPLRSPGELLSDPQLIARGFFGPCAEMPQVHRPTSPFTFSNIHDRSEHGWAPGDVTHGPLAGLRVLDLSRVWAGPMCTRILADLGAEVIAVEAPWQRGPQHFPQSAIDAAQTFPNNEAGERPWNRNSHQVNFALSKRGLSLNLQHLDGQAAFARLIPHFDVLVENFSPRVIPQLGFTENELHRLNPDLIYLTMPGYGRSGPAKDWLAYGSTVDSHAGLSHLIGYQDATPWKGGIAWPDPIAGLHATCAVLSALWAGQPAGLGGLTIEAAQFESTVAAIGEHVVAAQLDATPDLGNRSSSVFAQGVYRCLGDDAWIAITLHERHELTLLIAELDLDQTLATSFDHDQFDQAVGRATGLEHAHALAARLQTVGVVAGVVVTAPDLLADPHLASRSSWITIDQPDLGPLTAAVTPIGLSATPCRLPTAAPTLGQDNVQVLTAAGFTQMEIETLIESGVVVHQPPH